MKEYCRDDAAPVARECPACIDKYMALAVKVEAERNRLLLQIEEKNRSARALVTANAVMEKERDSALRQIEDFKAELRRCGETISSEFKQRQETLRLNGELLVSLRELYRNEDKELHTTSEQMDRARRVIAAAECKSIEKPVDEASTPIKHSEKYCPCAECALKRVDPVPKDSRNGCVDFGHKGPTRTANGQTAIRCDNCGEIVG